MGRKFTRDPFGDDLGGSNAGMDEARNEQTNSGTSFTCTECGKVEHVDGPAMSDERELSCDECMSRDIRRDLIHALANGGNERFTAGWAAMYLNTEFDDVFPIRDDERERWILSAEHDSLDGKGFVGKMTEIHKNRTPCPECGNTRRRLAWFDNGIIGGHRETCTVCEHVFSEDAG